jgi:nucleotide-binding universal stress UspA family protein
MQNILVTLDGSKISEQILPVALDLARRMKLPIILLGVNEPGHEIESAYINSKAFDLVAQGIEARPSVRSVDKKEQLSDFIARFAYENESVIIAMETHGRSGITRSSAGSTAWSMLSLCIIPLLLVKSRAKPSVKPIKSASSILLPLDGSARAEAAIPAAESIASLMGAKLVLFRVADPSYTVGGEDKPRAVVSPLERDRKARSTAESYLKKTMAMIKKVTASYEVELGAAVAESICRRADKPDIAFVFMATHGNSGLTCFIKGCVAEQVLGKCTTPIILFRPK